MTRTLAAALSIPLALSLATAPVAAQVGHAPSRSPYRDLEHRQELTFYGGVFRTTPDPAKVGPEDGYAAGVHYELRMAGPAYFVANLGGVQTERRVIDPNQLIVNRFVGMTTVNMMTVDVGFALNLTGYKSWHGLVPTVGGGLGVMSAFDQADVGQFKIGTPFLLAFRPGIKFAPRGHWQGRLDATNYFSRLAYPQTYFTKTTADPTVLTVGAGERIWKRNVALTLGLSYTFGR